MCYTCHFVSDATSTWKSSLLMCVSSVFPENDKVARITGMGFLPCLTHQCRSQVLRRGQIGHRHLHKGPSGQILPLLQVFVGSTLPCLARDNIDITLSLGLPCNSCQKCFIFTHYCTAKSVHEKV